MYRKQIVAALVLVLCFQSTAHAYLDAGTGSMILQAVLGGVAGLVVLAKMYWREFMGFFGRDPEKSQGSSE